MSTGGLKNSMIEYVKLDAFRKMRIWIDELPNENTGNCYEHMNVYDANSDVYWFEGIICIELRIAPRTASNYAMINLKFTRDESKKFKVVYKINDEEEIMESDIAMPNDKINTGIVKNYYKSMERYFEYLSQKNIFPCGTLEVLGGRYGTIGSSEVAVIIVLNILLNLYNLNNDLTNENINSLVLQFCKDNEIQKILKKE